MRPSRAQLLPLFVLLICMFGCKGGGQFLRVLGAVAVTTLRVAAVAVAVAGHESRVQARDAAQTAEGQRRAEEAAAYAHREQRLGRCTELVVEVVPPPPPGSPPPPRGFDCDGRVLLQDQDGSWRDYDVGGTPAVVTP